MNRKIDFFTISLVCMVLLSGIFVVDSTVCKAEPTTIVVPDDYSTIQEAVNAASNGDTVYVRAGTYYETVIVNKSVSLTGENPLNTIIDEYGVDVSASNVVICNFSITNSWIGISLTGSNITATGNCVLGNYFGIECESQEESAPSNITITGNRVSNNSFGIKSTAGDWSNPPSNISITGNNITENEHGIELSYSCRNFKISQNLIANNQHHGVSFWTDWPCVGPSYITISENNITGNGGSGIYCGGSGSVSNIILGNEISSNGEDGITLVCSRDHTISENRISDNAGDGIVLINRLYKSINSVNNTVYENTVVDNLNGVSLRGSSQNNVSLNRIVGNQIGVRLDYEPFQDGCFGEQNTISENDIIGSLQFGIWVRNSSNNHVYHNSLIDNDNSRHSENSTNIWDDGYPSGGNYWSDHNPPDEDGNKIGDQPYIIDEDNVDWYPLTYPYEFYQLGYIPETDMNSDKTVDILDINVTAIAFGSTPGDQNWNPMTDLNMDEVINILDITTVAVHWGETVD